MFNFADYQIPMAGITNYIVIYSFRDFEKRQVSVFSFQTGPVREKQLGSARSHQ